MRIYIVEHFLFYMPCYLPELSNMEIFFLFALFAIYFLKKYRNIKIFFFKLFIEYINIESYSKFIYIFLLLMHIYGILLIKIFKHTHTHY